MLCKKVFVFALTVAIAVSLSTVCAADGAEDKNSRVVTEYYSKDLYEDAVFHAATVPVSSAPEIDAKSFILMEASTGNILCEHNSNEVLSPASITKIMTMLLVVEAIDCGKISLKDTVATSEHAASMGGSQIWLEVGETMSVEQMLKAIAFGSANDASVALAELVGGSEEGFVGMMNSRAAQLGMKNTTFKNACGLDEEGHMTSAKDVALMSKELVKHDIIKNFTTIWMDTLRDGKTELVNTNKLVRFYMGTTGLKTGTTEKAGFCLSAAAKRDGMELVAVVMNASSSDERFTGAKKLLNYGFANWGIIKPAYDKNALSDIEVISGESNSVKVYLEPVKNLIIKLSQKDAVKCEFSIKKSISAPFDKNSEVGVLKIYVEDKVAEQYKVLTKTGVKEISFGFVLKGLLNCLISL